MKKIAIIGASYLQEPLIVKAKKKGIETHVFAWACGDVGEEIADYFYPISIVEKEEILEKCQEIGVDGICSIASDLAAITVNYVADKMNLVGNSLECTEKSTNKSLMRRCFEENGDPSPKSIMVDESTELEKLDICYPVIVKPIDRSGSRGITKLESKNGLEKAVINAMREGFEKKALIEEFADGEEYSVEYISWEGEHNFLALTKKYTTGAPGFIETGHMQPAPLEKNLVEKVCKITEHALDSLGIQYGASHTELKVDKNGNIRIIEIGGRMGGDFIGSHLVQLSTGMDFVEMVIDVALGQKPMLVKEQPDTVVGIRFVFSEQDIEVLDKIRENYKTHLYMSYVDGCVGQAVSDSSNRHGYFMLTADNMEQLEEMMCWNK